MLAPQAMTTSTFPTLDDPSAADPSTCGHKAAALANLVQAGFDVPPGFVVPVSEAAAPDPDVIAAALASLEGPVAVRSSGTAEDLPDASFAGQYDTVLGVEGVGAVMTAIARCVASASSARAQTYGGAGQIAVLVQAMVPAEAAGVAFSANPLTGAPDEVRISATRGLGDALVSGEVDGDEWIVRGDEACPGALPHEALTTKTVRQIAALARQLQAHFGAPQDVEWATVEDRVVVLQSRPITVLPQPPTVDVPKGSWQKDTAHYPGPITPFGASTVGLFDRSVQKMIDHWGLMPEAISMQIIGHEVYSRAEPDSGGKNPPPWWVLGIAARLVPSLRRKLRRAQAVIDGNLLKSTPPRWDAQYKPEIAAELRRLAEIDLTAFDDEALVEHFCQITAFAQRAMDVHFELFVPYLVGLYELDQVCARHLGWKSHETMRLLQGLSVTSSAPTRALGEIAQLARVRPEARAVIEQGGPDFVARLREVDDEVAGRLDEYLSHWGLRVFAYDPGSPSLSEQPALVAALLAELLDASPADDLQAQRREAVAQARAALEGEALVELDAALAFAEQTYPQREDNVLYTDNLPSGLMRRWALEVGRRLVERGQLPRATDAVMLASDELRAALGGKLADPAAVATRVRAELAWVRAHPGPLHYGPAPGQMPDVRGLPAAARRINGAMLWAMAQELAPPAATDGAQVHGQPASAGVATGPVRIIMSSHEVDRVRPGDVVVCPTTTPAWTVIFQRAAALVTDGGSVLSHAAIVAREHGIPAVVATGDGTRRLKAGQLVQVDGTTGRVTLLDETAATA